MGEEPKAGYGMIEPVAKRGGVDKSMISEVMAEMGRRGGSKQVAKGFSTLTPEERKANASAAAKARWGKGKKKAGAKKAGAKR